MSDTRAVVYLTGTEKLQYDCLGDARFVKTSLCACLFSCF